MNALASQITSLTIVCSTVYSGADQRKHQSSASLAFGRWIHQWPVKSPHRWPVTRKMLPFDDISWDNSWLLHVTLWHGNAVRITGPLWGWSTCNRWSSTRICSSLYVSLNKLNKLSSCRWFEASRCSCDGTHEQDTRSYAFRPLVTLNTSHDRGVMRVPADANSWWPSDVISTGELDHYY